MIHSRRTALVLASLAGFMSSYPSMLFGSEAIMAGAHNNHTADFRQILISFLSPVILLVAPVALLSRRNDRLVAVGAGLAGVICGFT